MMSLLAFSTRILSPTATSVGSFEAMTRLGPARRPWCQPSWYLALLPLRHPLLESASCLQWLPLQQAPHQSHHLSLLTRGYLLPFALLPPSYPLPLRPWPLRERHRDLYPC